MDRDSIERRVCSASEDDTDEIAALRAANARMRALLKRCLGLGGIYWQSEDGESLGDLPIWEEIMDELDSY